MFVVIYNPGAAGKMVSAVIDSTDQFESDATPLNEHIYTEWLQKQELDTYPFTQ
jgi:hypothetical protein